MNDGSFPRNHNQGPRLGDEHVPEWGKGGFGTYFEWRRAHRLVWKSIPAEIALRRLKHAEALGLTYEEYTSELLDTGRYLQAGDPRVAEIKRMRKGRVTALTGARSRAPASPARGEAKG
jgi:hypothetical protein